jgi:hypothetical protein
MALTHTDACIPLDWTADATHHVLYLTQVSTCEHRLDELGVTWTALPSALALALALALVKPAYISGQSEILKLQSKQVHTAGSDTDIDINWTTGCRVGRGRGGRRTRTRSSLI